MKIEEMILKNRADCSGCEACANICPKNAIKMVRDAEGFAYPKINAELCIKCGRCDSVCPSLNFVKSFPDALPKIFAAIHPDEKIRRHSSSGGAFSALSEIILQSGGLIFGASFDKNWHVVHTCARNLEELENLRGSKYVQSQIRDVYRQVKTALKSKKVLFSGTPCQCAGLKRFLGRDYENLLTVEIICHGTPPPALWEKYIGEFGRAHEITHVNFRSKRHGWQNSNLEITFADQGHYSKPLNQEIYAKNFLYGLTERPACHTCKFKFPSVQSDLTIADAWGVQNFAPEMFDNRGTSLVIIHTDKGEKFLSQANLKTQRVKFFDAVIKNPRFITATVPDERRGQFFQLLQRHDYLAVMQKFFAENDPAMRQRVDKKSQLILSATCQQIFANYSQRQKRNVLILTTKYNGGSEIFLDHYINLHFRDCGVYILKKAQNNQLVCMERNLSFRFSLEENAVKLSALVKNFGITEIFVNHLVNFNLSLMGNWLINCGLPYKFFIHDYFSLCPHHRLVCREKFCASSDTNNYCRKKFLEGGYAGIRLEDWRKFFALLLSRAEKVIAPTTFTANVIKGIYRNLSIEVEPHYLTQPLQKTFKPEFALREKLRVIFLGNMFVDKGEEYMLRLNDFIRRENLPIEFVLLGEYTKESDCGTSEGIIFAGKYNYRKVSALLAKFETAFVAVLTLCPETYNYTTSEAILSGYPVLCSNIGAQAFRVQKNSCGWVVNLTSPEKGLNDLKNFLKTICTARGRQEIINRAALTSNFVNGME